MKTTPILTSLLFLLAVPVHGHARGDALWAKAQALAAASQDELPQRLDEHEVVRDMAGKIEEETRNQYRITLDLKLKPVVELIRSTRDGVDQTAMKLKSQTDAGDHGLLDGGGDPFESPGVAHSRTGRTRTIDGRSCVEFQWKLQHEGTTWEGLACLDAETGAPRLTEATPTPPPTMEGVTIEEMVVETRYRLSAEGRLRVREVVSALRISAPVMPLVTFEGRVTHTLTFSDYLER